MSSTVIYEWEEFVARQLVLVDFQLIHQVVDVITNTILNALNIFV